MRQGRLTSAMRSEMIERRRVRMADMQERRRRAASYESPGRRIGKVAGSWIYDIAAVKQCVMLCWECNPKWNPFNLRKIGDHVWDKFYKVSGKCDGCRKLFMDGSLRFYIHEHWLAQGQRLHEPVR